MIDQINIEVHGGDGGRGAVSFHREKFVLLGGPDGGRGGRGGHVIVLASGQQNSLARYQRGRRYHATSGQPGSANNRRGRDGEDLILEVPPGTVVSRLDADGDLAEAIADLVDDGSGVIVARGGRGGHGNAHFKSATNRAPQVAQKGQAGQRARVRLELRLIADIGIVGLPNAGKSTLLRWMSAARPRVAAYPFTTLEPHLGLVQVGWGEFVLADLPGLIEGAAAGAGLGHEFLRHTGRTQLLIHLVDGGAEDPSAALDLVDAELRAYSEHLAEKQQIVVINKLDMKEVQANRAVISARLAARSIEPMFVSALTGEGVDGLAARCMTELERVRAEAPAAGRHDPVVIRPKPDSRRFTVERDAVGFRVRGRQVEIFVEMMEIGDDAAMEEVYRWLQRRGVTAALRRAGLEPGHNVRIGPATWVWDA